MDSQETKTEAHTAITKGKAVSEERELPTYLPELTPLDPSTECPVYTTAIQKLKEGGAIEYMDIYLLESLQKEIEILLCSVLKRQDAIERESNTLTQDKTCQEKSDKKFTDEKSEEGEHSGKKSFELESTPNKKFKDSAGRPKTKVFQAHDSDDSELPEESKPLRTDAPNRFWASLEPYFADITSAHIKFLEEWIKDHEDDEPYFQIPPIGKHYSSEWGNKDIREEQKEGLKALEKNKGHSNNSSLVLTDPENILSEAEKDSESEETPPLAPLAQRLTSCLIEDKIMPSLEDTIGTNEEFPENPANPNSETNFLTSLSIGESMTLEKRIRKELEESGIIDPVPVEEVKNEDDPVLVELKELQASLKIVTEYNLVKKKELLQRAKKEMARQEIEKKLRYLDSEIVDASRRKQKKKAFSKKEKEQILVKLKERETLKAELESMGDFYL